MHHISYITYTRKYTINVSVVSSVYNILHKVRIIHHCSCSNSWYYTLPLLHVKIYNTIYIFVIQCMTWFKNNISSYIEYTARTYHSHISEYVSSLLQKLCMLKCITSTNYSTTFISFISH